MNWIFIGLYFLVSFVGSAIIYGKTSEETHAFVWFLIWPLYIPVWILYKIWTVIADEIHYNN
jgi:hypothetical protein